MNRTNSLPSLRPPQLVCSQLSDWYMGRGGDSGVSCVWRLSSSETPIVERGDHNILDLGVNVLHWTGSKNVSKQLCMSSNGGWTTHTSRQLL